MYNPTLRPICLDSIGQTPDQQSSSHIYMKLYKWKIYHTSTCIRQVSHRVTYIHPSSLKGGIVEFSVHGKLKFKPKPHYDAIKQFHAVAYWYHTTKVYLLYFHNTKCVLYPWSCVILRKYIRLSLVIPSTIHFLISKPAIHFAKLCLILNKPHSQNSSYKCNNHYI